VYVAALTALTLKSIPRAAVAAAKSFVFIAQPPINVLAKVAPAQSPNGVIEPAQALGPYVIRAAGPGLWNAANDLLFVATAQAAKRITVHALSILPPPE
jgi:hypothetical protein